MKITLAKDSPLNAAVDVLVVGVCGKKPAEDAEVARLDKATGGALGEHIKNERFKAKRGHTLSFQGRGGKLKARRVVLVGMGVDEPAASDLRYFAVRAALVGEGHASLAVIAPSTDPASLSVLADGLTTGAYRYTRYLTGKRQPKHRLAKVSLLVTEKPSAEQRAALAAGVAVGECVNLARDLVNCPPNDLSATELGNVAAQQSQTHGVSCKIYDKKAIQKLGMPLLLAVNRGSVEEPRFIHMTYKPRGKGPFKKVVFVGKGLTFDSGGLCLKPAASMLDMKCDMAGAATTLGTVLAAARLKLQVEVHALIGSTDNMTGGNAYRPGDIFPSREGKTVEIINTDAEGRLVLADVLAFATELKPDYLVDHATLTGACMVALGRYTAGLFCNDEPLNAHYQEAAKASGETFWRMPFDEALRDQLRSPIADLKHMGGSYGGAILAALFLREFVGDCKWIHLDIAGPAFLDKRHEIAPKGGTGFGVYTAVEFLKRLSA
jgi:leucyl aminopeptidase